MKPQGIAKKTVAGVVALALGASAVVAPQAHALPAEFVSPPGRVSNPEQGQCTVVLSINTTSVSPGRAFAQSQSGVTVGVGLDAGNTQFTPWITLDPEGERIFESAKANITVENEALQSAAHNYSVEMRSKGSYDAGPLDSGENAVLDITDLSPVKPDQFSLAQGQKQIAHGTLGVDPASTGAQTWAWKITSPTIRAHERSRVSPEAVVNVAPWPIESDDCLPLTPSEKKSQPIIADGKEYNTGITVSNGAASDYARLTGNVSIAGKKIEGAKVRVDASGKVFVTLPKGATGADDNKKTAKVDVELLAQPREATKDSAHESYNTAQVLRVVDGSGQVNQDSALFVGSVPVQKFAPAYNSPSTVKPGASVDVALKTQPGNVRGHAVGATYTVVNPPQGWTAQPAKDGTLKVTAPKGAKHGDEATFNVKVTYTDGSSDTITTVVKVQDDANNLHTPGYGETYGKVNTEVTLEQNNKDLPEGSTFTITPEQDLGDWAPKVDPNTGTITVTIPDTAKDGDEKTILINVKDPKSGKTETVPGKVIVKDPKQPDTPSNPNPNNNTTIVIVVPKDPDATVEIDKDKTPEVPDGSTPPAVTPGNGQITINIPNGVQPGTKITIPVTITNPDGSKETKEITVEVPELPKNDGNNVVIVTPGGNGDVKVPEGWTYTKDGDNIIVHVPGGTKPGDYTVTVPGPNNTNVDVQVTVPNTDPNNGKGSSDAVNKCFENAITSPLFYLLPIGILGAVAGNLAAPYMTEVNNQLNSLARQFNSDVNFDFGLGNNGWDNSTNNYNQFGAIGEQFGAFMNDPNLRELGTIALGLLGALATAGLLYDWCSHEPGEAVTSIGSAKKDAPESSRAQG